MPAPNPRGPAHTNHLPSTHPSNPYGFSPTLTHAGKLPAKITDKYVFFFGYEGEQPEVCLQQWFPCPMVDVEGRDFPTTEHYMEVLSAADSRDPSIVVVGRAGQLMWRKAMLMGDQEIADTILREPHPSAAKRLGRKVHNFDLEIWKAHADKVVEEANYLKFSQNEDLKDVLLETGDKILVEASPDDKIWGIGFNSEEAEGRESEWGHNGLGKALMKVRERLRGEGKGA